MKKVIILIFCIAFLNSCTSKKEKAKDYMMKALVKSDNYQLKEALIDLDQSLALDSTNAKVWYLRGCTKLSLRMFKEAIPDFDKAILINDKYMDAYYNRGYTYSVMGNKDKACENYFIAYKMGKPNIDDKISKCKETN